MSSRPNAPKPTGPSPAPVDPLVAKIRAQHLIDHPNCTFGDRPHYIPPGAGMVGFYECDPPADLTNHTRCRPPYDHEHADHRTDAALSSVINTPDAVTVIARHFIHGAIEHELDNGWELYPEIGQHDWESVEARVKTIVKDAPTQEQFRIAYEHLESRQKCWAIEHPDED